MYRILIDSFSQNPTLYIVPKTKLDKYLESAGISKLENDPRAKDWLYNHTSIVRSLSSKRIKVTTVV